MMTTLAFTWSNHPMVLGLFGIMLLLSSFAMAGGGKPAAYFFMSLGAWFFLSATFTNPNLFYMWAGLNCFLIPVIAAMLNGKPNIGCFFLLYIIGGVFVIMGQMSPDGEFDNTSPYEKEKIRMGIVDGDENGNTE